MRRIPTRWLLAGGLLGPVLFVVVDALDGTTRPGYDPIRQFVSVLGLGDRGWLGATSFLVPGLLIAGLGVALGRMAGSRADRGVAALVCLTGIGFTWSGVFPTDPQWGYPVWITPEAAANPTWHAHLHLLGGYLASSALPSAILLDAWVAAGAGDWRHVRYGLITVAAMGSCFAVGLAIGGPGAAFAWGGILQRAAVVSGFQWLALLATRRLGAMGGLQGLDGGGAARILTEPSSQSIRGVPRPWLPGPIPSVGAPRRQPRPGTGSSGRQSTRTASEGSAPRP